MMQNRIVGLYSFDVKWIVCKILTLVSIICDLSRALLHVYAIWLGGFCVVSISSSSEERRVEWVCPPSYHRVKAPRSPKPTVKRSVTRTVCPTPSVTPTLNTCPAPWRQSTGRLPSPSFTFTHSHAHTQTEVIFISSQVTESNGLAGVPRKRRQLPASDGGRAERVPD